MAEADEFEIINMNDEELKDIEKEQPKHSWKSMLFDTVNKKLTNIKNTFNKKYTSKVEKEEIKKIIEEDYKKKYEEEDWIINDIKRKVSIKLSSAMEEFNLQDDYQATEGVLRKKRSISASKVEEDKDYEEITDENYVLTEDEWLDVLAQTNKLSKIQKQRLFFSIKVGLPPKLRGRIWEFLVKVSKYKKRCHNNYSDFLSMPDVDDTEFTISKDVKRTFPSIDKHKEDWKTGTNKLFNVCKAYAAADPNVKYCQGMNYIVFLFLENWDQDEERAFWLLYAMMIHLKWRKLYKLDTPKLLQLLERLKKKMKKEVEDIYNRLVEYDLPVEGVFAPYFLTLFLYSTPIQVAEKIIDCFLHEGENFLLDMTVKMLRMKRSKIMKFVDDDFSAFHLQNYLSKQMVEEWCSDTTIKSILNQSYLSTSKRILPFNG